MLQGVYITSVKFGGCWPCDYFLIVFFLGPQSKIGHTCNTLSIDGQKESQNGCTVSQI